MRFELSVLCIFNALVRLERIFSFMYLYADFSRKFYVKPFWLLCFSKLSLKILLNVYLDLKRFLFFI